MSSEHNDRDGSRQSDLAVMDVEEYKNKRLIKRILDMQERVIEQTNHAKAQYIEGEIQREGRNMHVYSAVEDYINVAYGLLSEHKPDGLAGIRWDTVFATEKPIGVIRFEQEDPVQLWSIADFHYTDEVHFEEWMESYSPRHMQTQYERCTNTVTVPMEASKNAFLLVNQYLAQEWNIAIQTEPKEIEVEADPF